MTDGGASRRDHLEVEATVNFVERATSSSAFVVIRRVDDGLALGIGVEASGDLDLVVSDDDARSIAVAILAALEPPAE